MHYSAQTHIFGCKSKKVRHTNFNASIDRPPTEWHCSPSFSHETWGTNLPSSEPQKKGQPDPPRDTTARAGGPPGTAGHNGPDSALVFPEDQRASSRPVTSDPGPQPPTAVPPLLRCRGAVAAGMPADLQQFRSWTARRRLQTPFPHPADWEYREQGPKDAPARAARAPPPHLVGVSVVFFRVKFGAENSRPVHLGVFFPILGFYAGPARQPSGPTTPEGSS